ncbi:MAG: NAD(P)H-hydrate dehydratase [Candidatus Rokubacteria bacterium]|nr:NAD(P)H-hydrate dehydratase [Candidatus Rokubacteria bacterium]
MLPVFTAAEMRALDLRATSQLGIPGPRLMEAAGAGAARLIAERFAPIRGKGVLVLCGKGNNGGDGFVVARHLKTRGAGVRVLLCGRRAEVRGDAARALGRWRGRVEEIVTVAQAAAVGDAARAADVVVDGLLGTGLEGPARGITASVIEAINDSRAPAVALDLPSGLSADGAEISGPTVRARFTATFAGWKRALLVHPAAGYAGEVAVIPIGIPEAEVGRGIGTWLLEEADIRSHFPARRRDAHKGSYGHLLIVAGSVGKTGAAALAGRAALRSGVGLVTVATPASQQPIVASLGMESMTEPLAETAAQTLSLKSKGRILELAGRTEAVALGPGLSLDPETQSLVRELLRELPKPMVVDADGLTALAGASELLEGAAGPRLLTPHPGEMARMLGVPVSQVQADRIEMVRVFCARRRVWAVLKGAGSVIGAPDGDVFVNPTGNPGMATGGSGDVLTGMVGAFLARGLDPLAALQSAVYLHGLAGDLACARWGEEGLIAGDIIEAIPGTLRPETPPARQPGAAGRRAGGRRDDSR